MAKKSNQEIFLKDYKAPAYLVDAVELNFELHPSRTKVYSKISFRKNPNPNSANKFFLNGEKLNFLKILYFLKLLLVITNCILGVYNNI